MANPFKIPFAVGKPQLLGVTLNGVRYTLRIYWNDPAQCWNLDLNDVNNNPILQGIPLVTGLNLLSQYAYLQIGGSLIVQTTNDASAVPTFVNMGDSGNLFYLI